MIWLSEIDLDNFKLIGEKTKIWGGAFEDAYYPEGPHLYRIGNYYYLIIAEGEQSIFILKQLPDLRICVAPIKDIGEIRY